MECDEGECKKHWQIINSERIKLDIKNNSSLLIKRMPQPAEPYLFIQLTYIMPIYTMIELQLKHMNSIKPILVRLANKSIIKNSTNEQTHDPQYH